MIKAATVIEHHYLIHYVLLCLKICFVIFPLNSFLFQVSKKLMWLKINHELSKQSRYTISALHKNGATQCCPINTIKRSAYIYKRSNITAIPCPPPMHIVTSAYLPPTRCSSWMALVAIIAPEAPIG